jgi:putative transposase
MGFAGSRAVDEDAATDLPRFIDQVYNAVCRHSTIGYISHVEFERKMGSA